MKEIKFDTVLKYVGIAVLAFIIIIAGLAIASFIGGNADTVSVEYYYLSSNGKLKAVSARVDNTNVSDEAMNILTQLRDGQKMEGYTLTVPKEIEFQGVTVEDGTATVDLNTAYYNMSSADSVILRSSIVWSLTSLEEIQSVCFTVNKKEVMKKDGTPLGVLNRDNMLIDAEISAINTEYAVLRLYFSNEDGTDLVKEERIIEINANKAREWTILEQLISGPIESDKKPTLSSDLVIRDVTTADGICYVNLSQEFVTKNNNGYMAIYSMVNSLCTLSHIDKVQFLVEGKKLDMLGNIDLSQPLEARTSIADLLEKQSSKAE